MQAITNRTALHSYNTDTQRPMQRLPNRDVTYLTNLMNNSY